MRNRDDSQREVQAIRRAVQDYAHDLVFAEYDADLGPGEVCTAIRSGAITPESLGKLFRLSIEKECRTRSGGGKK